MSTGLQKFDSLQYTHIHTYTHTPPVQKRKEEDMAHELLHVAHENAHDWATKIYDMGANRKQLSMYTDTLIIIISIVIIINISISSSIDV